MLLSVKSGNELEFDNNQYLTKNMKQNRKHENA